MAMIYNKYKPSINLVYTIYRVCYSVNDPMTKGRASQVYEKILANYSKLSDKEFQQVLRAGLTDWVSKVTQNLLSYRFL
jgi:hypothetical protein